MSSSSATSSSSPSPAEIFYEPSGANCSGTEYTRASINAAALKALQLAKQKKTLGKDKYPHAYNDYEKFSFPHAVKPYLEFPILPFGQVYSGGQPETDRVVIGSIAEDFSSAIYCGVITHQGEENNEFQMCRDDTMNVRGNGGDVGSDGKEAEHKRRHHRKLRERIDME